MSVLDQDAGRRLVARLHAPLPEHTEAFKAWERGEPFEWRFKNAEDRWRPWIREWDHGHCRAEYSPNWQNEDVEFRVVSS